MSRSRRRNWLLRLLCPALLGLGLGLGLGLLLPRPCAADTPQEVLREAARAYDRSEFPQVIELIRPLLYPQIQLSSQEQVIEAYKLLGLSFLFEKQPARAEKQFMAILSLRPDFALDPLVDPPAAVAFLEEVKRRNAQKIAAIRERERREAERKRQEELAQEAARQRALRDGADKEIIVRTVVEHPYWINFVPFGAGQFQNGQRTKGYLLLGTQLGLGALSLGTALSLRLLYPDGQVPPEEYSRARGLAITQTVTGALFLGVATYGIIDALIHHQPRSVQERRLTQRKVSWFLAPTVGPQAAGLGFGMSY